jgi:hypothetical protein
MGSSGADLLQGDAGIQKALYYFENQNVAEAVKPMGSRTCGVLN